MAWGDNYRYQARDHDAQAARLIEEADRFDADATRLQRQLADESASDASDETSIPSSPHCHAASSVSTLPPPAIPRRRGTPVHVPSRDLDEVFRIEKDPAKRRELTDQRTLRYLAQANDPTYAELTTASRHGYVERAPGIRRLAFLLRSIPVVIGFAFLPQFVPAFPKVVLNSIGPALTTLFLAGTLILIWLGWAVLPRLRNCRLPLALGLGVFVPVLSAIIGILCLVMPEKKGPAS